MLKTLCKFSQGLAFVCSCLASSLSHAELGAEVNKDAVLTQQQSSVVSTVQTLNVYQVTAASGSRIKEYVNENNIVVAVSWQGPSLPNLQQLLGPYFQTFANRSTEHSTSHRSAELHTDDLVVQSHGQMRNFSGRAYLPKLLPPQFNLDQIN